MAGHDGGWNVGLEFVECEIARKRATEGLPAERATSVTATLHLMNLPPRPAAIVLPAKHVFSTLS
jgi:hypothetical protein